MKHKDIKKGKKPQKSGKEEMLTAVKFKSFPIYKGFLQKLYDHLNWYGYKISKIQLNDIPPEIRLGKK
jgi:hypothetical protein